MAVGFRSIFTGEEIDEAVGRVLSGDISSGHMIIPTTDDNRADLNQLVDPKVYHIDYYENGYDDSANLGPIDLYVGVINAQFYIQFYEINNRRVYRLYRLEDEMFTEWKIDEPYKIASADDVISVDKPTLVIRQGGDTINAEPSIMHKVNM